MQTDICTFVTISRSFHLRMRNVSDKSCRENQNTHFVFHDDFFLNRALHEMMWKNIVDGAGHRWQYCACALHAAYLRLQTHTHTHTHTICNTHGFSVATTVARTHHNVTLYVHGLCCSVWLYKTGEQLPEFRADHCPVVMRHVQETNDYEGI